MILEGIAFDLEGTCIDLEQYHFDAYVKTLNELGIQITATEVMALPGVIGGGSAFVVSALTEKYPEIDFSDFSERKKVIYENVIKHAHIEAREGLVQFLEMLRARNIPIAIGSRTPREKGEWYLSVSGLDRFFDSNNTIFMEDVAVQKPAPDVYTETARCMCISPQQQVVFEDSVIGIEAGVRAGSFVVAVPSPLGLSSLFFEELKEAGTQKIFHSWNEIDEDELERLIGK